SSATPAATTSGAASTPSLSTPRGPSVTLQITRWAAETQRALGEARGAGLGPKSQCLDHALSELHALGRIAQRQQRSSSAAGPRGSAARTSLRSTYRNAHASYRRAQACGGVRITESGSQLKVWIDPRIARFEPRHPEDQR